MTKSPEVIAEGIKTLRRQKDAIDAEIDRIAKHYIPDFHFLDYRVSTFWSCEKSPIGMCVFKLEYDKNFYTLGHSECRYCGEPEERK